jgi:hypothetical protein
MPHILDKAPSARDLIPAAATRAALGRLSCLTAAGIRPVQRTKIRGVATPSEREARKVQDRTSDSLQIHGAATPIPGIGATP